MLTSLLVSFFILLALGMPIAFAIGTSAMIAIMVIGNLPPVILPQRLFVMVDSFSLMAVPLFILAGELMGASGITNRIVKFASTLVGHIKGGLAHVNVVSSMIMAGVSGSAAADASAIGSVMIPFMTKEGYKADFAAALTAAASTIGPIIPPSIMMIIYASMTNVSVGRMFLGGIIPGVLIGLSLMGFVYVMAVRRGYKARTRATLREMGRALLDAIWALIMPLIILGGILSGIFTPTESGAVACVYALIVGFITKELKLKELKQVFLNAASSTTVVMFIIGISSIFGWLMAREQVPQIIAGVMTSLTSDQTMMYLIIIAIYLFLGSFMEANSIMIILTPVFAPLAARMGFDPVHFGVITVMALLVGTITPPVGLLLFISASIAKISIEAISKAIWPFVILIIGVILLATFVPGIITWLPSILMK